MPVWILLLLGLAGCAEALDSAQALETRVMDVGGREVRVQVADEQDERSRGLMFVKAMADDEGMVFVWPDADERSFWMKNTYIPLDLIYVRDGLVTHIVEGAVPFDESALLSNGPADTVVEVNAGWVARHGLKRGDSVQFK